MIVFAAIAAACVTGTLFALIARTQGIDHHGLLFAIGVMGAGVQLPVLIIWYLMDDSRRAALTRACARGAWKRKRGPRSGGLVDCND